MSNETLSVGTGFKTEDVGLVAVGKPTYAQWEIALSVACGIAKSCPWWIGDLLNIGEHTYGETYSQALSAIGLDEGTLKNYKYVSSRIPIAERHFKMTFSHHALVASMDKEERDEWLSRAEGKAWTVKEMREAVSGDDGSEGARDDEGDDLSGLFAEIEGYLAQLTSNAERIIALKAILRKVKALAGKYRRTD